MHFIRTRARRGSAAVEYLVVTTLAVTTLVLASDGSNPLHELGQAIINFYADYSFSISLATP